MKRYEWEWEKVFVGMTSLLPNIQHCLQLFQLRHITYTEHRHLMCLFGSFGLIIPLTVWIHLPLQMLIHLLLTILFLPCKSSQHCHCHANYVLLVKLLDCNPWVLSWNLIIVSSGSSPNGFYTLLIDRQCHEWASKYSWSHATARYNCQAWSQLICINTFFNLQCALLWICHEYFS